MAATETVKPSMPETVEAAEMVRAQSMASWPTAWSKGPSRLTWPMPPTPQPRSMSTARSSGHADIMLFPNLLSANLTVKAIMYTADCKFGGVLRGTAAPVVFMSRADTTETRLNSLALALRILDHRVRMPELDIAESGSARTGA